LNALQIKGSCELLDNEKDGKSTIRFSVYATSEEDLDNDSVKYDDIPFQVAYATSIHKAQGLEYNSVKIIITEEVDEMITYNIFYTAITRAREKLIIYWSPEVEKRVLSNLKKKSYDKDLDILKSIYKPKDTDLLG
jgi:helicase, putative